MKSLFYDLVVLCIVGGMVAWYGEIDPAAFSSQSELDLVQYARMAAAAPLLDRTVPAPFVYRIAPPYLAGTLAPYVGSELNAFRLLTYLALAVCALQFRRWLVDRGVGDHTAFVVTAMVCCSPHIAGAVIFNPYQLTDALSFLVIIVALRALESRAWWVFGVSILIGAVTRETCMLMIPVAAVWIMRTQHDAASRWIHMRTMLAWTMPSIVATFALRHVMEPVNADWNVVGNFEVYAWKLTDPVSWYRLLVNSLIPISVLPFFFVRAFNRYVNDNLHLVALYVLIVVASFAGKDVERLIAPSFPFLFGFAAITINKHVPSGAWTYTILVLGSLLAAMHPLYMAAPLLDKNTYIVVAVFVAFAVPALLFTRRVRDF